VGGKDPGNTWKSSWLERSTVLEPFWMTEQPVSGGRKKNREPEMGGAARSGGWSQKHNPFSEGIPSFWKTAYIKNEFKHRAVYLNDGGSELSRTINRKSEMVDDCVRVWTADYNDVREKIKFEN
jgi:hypothetical protein